MAGAVATEVVVAEEATEAEVAVVAAEVAEAEVPAAEDPLLTVVTRSFSERKARRSFTAGLSRFELHISINTAREQSLSPSFIPFRSSQCSFAGLC